jgi:hypothetical protein
MNGFIFGSGISNSPGPMGVLVSGDYRFYIFRDINGGSYVDFANGLNHPRDKKTNLWWLWTIPENYDLSQLLLAWNAEGVGKGLINYLTVSKEDWPSTAVLEKDFAKPFQEKVVDRFVNNQDYIPQNANHLANDLMYSDDLSTQKYSFVLRPIEIRIKTYENNTLINSQMYYTDPYIKSNLPTVLNPGYYEPLTIYSVGNTAYKFVICYQIHLLF